MNKNFIFLLCAVFLSVAGWFIYRDATSFEIRTLHKNTANNKLHAVSAKTTINTTRAEVDENAQIIIAAGIDNITDIDGSKISHEEIAKLLKEDSKAFLRRKKHSIYQAQNNAQQVLGDTLEPIIREALLKNKDTANLTQEQISKRIHSLTQSANVLMSFVRKDGLVIVLVSCPMNGPHSLASAIGQRVVYERTSRKTKRWLANMLASLSR